VTNNIRGFALIQRFAVFKRLRSSAGRNFSAMKSLFQFRERRRVVVCQVGAGVAAAWLFAW
jgi:hypothetical protein